MTWFHRIIYIFDIGAADGSRGYPRAEHGIAMPLYPAKPGPSQSTATQDDASAATPFLQTTEARCG